MKRRLYVNVEDTVYSLAEQAIEARKAKDGIKITMTQLVEGAIEEKAKKLLSESRRGF